MNLWSQNVPVLFFMAVLILVFFFIDVYVRKFRSIGISSVIAYCLFIISIALQSVPSSSNVTVVKMVGCGISYFINWPMSLIFKILNLERITFHSYNMMMLVDIGLFVINVFVIYGIIKLISYIKRKMSVKKAILGGD